MRYVAHTRGLVGAGSLRSREGGVSSAPPEQPPPPCCVSPILCGFFVSAWQSSTTLKSAQLCELAYGMDGLRLALAFAYLFCLLMGEHFVLFEKLTDSKSSHSPLPDCTTGPGKTTDINTHLEGMFPDVILSWSVFLPSLAIQECVPVNMTAETSWLCHRVCTVHSLHGAFLGVFVTAGALQLSNNKCNHNCTIE